MPPFSQINASPAVPQATDRLVGVSQADVDLLYSLQQIATAVAALMTSTSSLTIGTTTILNGVNGQVLYDNGGVLGLTTGGGGGGGVPSNNDYVVVPASTTARLLGSTGTIGNVLATILVVPATTSPGTVSIQDSIGGTPIVVFPGGAASIGDLRPFTLTLGLPSLAGGWYVNTGANVSVVASGTFT